MKRFDVQSVELPAPFDKAFQYIADPVRLPEWTHAFSSVQDGTAVMVTPAGAVRVALSVDASARHGTIDWTMRFPNGEVASAASRLVAAGERSIYTFVLQPPPAPLEQLEGALAEQSRILADELRTLARRLADA